MSDPEKECRKAMFWDIYWKARAHMRAPKETIMKKLIESFIRAPGPCFAG